MNETRKLNVLKNLKDMSVINSGTGERLGVVQDAIIHPTQGRLLGILVRDNEGQPHSLGVQSFLIGRDAVMTEKDFRYESEIQNADLRDSVPAEQINGTSIVTGDGRLLGRISEIYVSAEEPRIAYYVTESTLQRFFGGGFYLAGDVVRAYAPDGVRLIVPEDTESRYATDSLENVFGTPGVAA